MGSSLQVGLTPEQHAMRRTGIAASEVEAVLGLSRYKSPLDVWAEKTGRVQPDWSPKSQAAKMGHLLEPVVAQLAQEHYEDAGLRVSLEQGETTQSKAFPWMLATPDRLVRQYFQPGDHPSLQAVDRWLLEIKTKSWHTFKDFGAPGTDQMPDGILLQTLWQMAVVGAERCDVAVLVDGREFQMFRNTYNEELLTAVQDRVYDFWTRYVLTDTEPPVHNATDVEYLRRKFKEPTAELMRPSVDMEGAVARLAEAKAAAKVAEEQEEIAKARVMQLLGGHTGVHTTYGKVSWGTVKGRASTDWKAVVAEAAVPHAIIEQHTTIGAPSRQFRFTPAKGE
jgi:putative phage-type endonuclease